MSAPASGPWEGWCDEDTIHPDVSDIHDLRCDVYDVLFREGAPNGVASHLAEVIAAKLWMLGYKPPAPRHGGEWE